MRLSKNGLTLAEVMVLLVVAVAIAAILSPVFGTAREDAALAQCQDNCRKLAMAMQMYASDNDNTMPPYYRKCALEGHREKCVTRWCEFIFPYVKDKQTYLCPVDVDQRIDIPHVPERTACGSYGVNQNGARVEGFAYSRDFLKFGPVFYENRPVKVAWIQDPAGTYLLGDDGPSANYQHWLDVQQFIDGVKAATEVHNGGVNVAFCDGHVKWISAADMAKRGGGWTLAKDD
jgi:prepilin-type processing-associated H-X9-DG protein